jgi:molybdenum cofactor biosynthesis protein B
VSAHDHEEAAARHHRDAPIELMLVTVSDSRTPETDQGGDRLQALVINAGHLVRTRKLVPDDADAIRGSITTGLEDASIQAILLTGGTGISPRDGTVEVVRSMISVELEGYGERFRAISVESIGIAGLLSRACGGVIRRSDGSGVLVFSMPGSVNAVETATTELILPLIAHAAWEVGRR